MRRLCIILIIIALFSFSVYAACYDDDKGINYKQKGTCKDTNGTEASDSCMKTDLIEYYCIKDSCAAQLKICSKCSDGVCLGPEAEDIVEVNKAPEVVLYVMTTPGKTSVAFKAEVSDPEKETVVYTIEFGDGKKASNQESIVHDYLTNGTFKVTITALDASGRKTIYTKDVVIEPQKMVETPKKTEETKEATTEVKEQTGFFARIKEFFKNLFRR